MIEEVDDKNKRKYELSFLLKDEDTSFTAKILKKHGADILSESRISKLRLSYPIKKETQAYFSYFHFEAEPQAVEKIANDLKLEAGSILRYLIISAPAARIAAERPSYTPLPPEPKRRETELTNEELERKIEEIKV